jgi:hypothetical protein
MVKMYIGKKQMYILYVVGMKDGEQYKVISTSIAGMLKKINRFTGRCYGRNDISWTTIVDEDIL